MLETSDLIILLLLVANHKPREMWKTPICLVVCSLQQSGKSYSEIRKETGLKHSTIQGILKALLPVLPGRVRHSNCNF
jgi:tRNA(Phe) wybutosine-synthesizing methylase Tyw3